MAPAGLQMRQYPCPWGTFGASWGPGGHTAVDSAPGTPPPKGKNSPPAQTAQEQKPPELAPQNQVLQEPRSQQGRMQNEPSVFPEPPSLARESPRLVRERVFREAAKPNNRGQAALYPTAADTCYRSSRLGSEGFSVLRYAPPRWSPPMLVCCYVSVVLSTLCVQCAGAIPRLLSAVMIPPHRAIQRCGVATPWLNHRQAGCTRTPARTQDRAESCAAR